MSTGPIAAHAAHLRLVLPLITPRRRIGYVGWAGHGNLGDEAVMSAAASFSPLPLADVPPGRLFTLFATVSPWPLVSSLFLGGGTLIGRHPFRFKVERVLERYPDVPAVTFGTGVEDPLFEARPQRSTEAELRRWVPLLERFRSVSVRGARSAEILGAVGIRARPVGDAALLLAPADEPGEVSEPILGLSIGSARVTWGQSRERIIDVSTQVAQRFQRRGWRIVLLSLSRSDEANLARVRAALDGPIEVIAEYDDPQRLMHELSNMRLVVGERLHSLVLGACVSVPCVAIEYHPKCHEFQESVGMARYCIRADRLTVRVLEGLLDELDGDYTLCRSILRRRVMALRAVLEKEAELVTREITHVAEAPSPLR